MKRVSLIVLSLMLLVLRSLAAELTGFRVNRMQNPTGILRTAQFSWQIRSSKRDVTQVAYAIRVAKTVKGLQDENLLYWDSEKVKSPQCLQIPYQGRRLPYASNVYWQVEVWLSNGEYVKSPVQMFQTGLKPEAWKARWIGIKDLKNVQTDGEGRRDLPARYLRREFRIDGKVKRAMLYISGMGYSAGFINGKAVSEDVFGTLPTDYNKTVYYNTYDVTSLVRKGDNAISALLGNGYALGLRKGNPVFGTPALMAQLVVETAKDTVVIVTDSSWKATNEGPIQKNNLYDGEFYDARREMKGWTIPLFDDSGWAQADVMRIPDGVFDSQPCQGRRTQERIAPVSIRQTGDGKYLVDMGQNMVGQLQTTLQGKTGQPVVLRHAEILDPKNEDEIYMANLRTAQCTNTYVPASDGIFTYQPALVYQGFRFVEISGITAAPKPEDIVGHVQYDRMETRATFECDNELLNRLHKNAFWGIRGNYQGMPVDCPQRDERMGWTGDRVTGCYGENLLFDNAPLYYKWLQDMMDTQLEDGHLSVTVPIFWDSKYREEVTWTAAMVYVTYMLYTRHADLQAVRKYYPALRNWARYVMSAGMVEGVMTKDRYGDWCMPPERQELIHSEDSTRKTEAAVLSSTVFYDCLRMMAEMADKLGLNADRMEYQKISRNLKEAYNRKFFNPQTARYSNNTVTANLLSLELGLVPDGYEERVMQNIIDVTEKQFQGHVSCGVLGIQHLMRGLTRRGHSDLAMKMVTQRTYPSYGYMIDHGATTIWELWNGDTANPAMNSGNHVMLLGDLLLWYYEDLAGIRQDRGSLGYKKLLMKPCFPDELNHVKATHQGAYGPIYSEWSKEGDRLTWHVEIPANTTARLYIPTRFNVHPESGNGVRRVEITDKGTVIDIGSGKYTFCSTLN